MKRFPKQDTCLVLMDNGSPTRRHTPAYGLPWTLVILILLSIQSLYAQPVAINGALSVSGNKIVNKNGVAVSFAGNSLFWSNDGWGGEKFYTAGVVSWLRNDWNSAIVRAAMGVEDAGGYLSNKAGNKAKVKAVVDAAIANDMYVIIDYHSHIASANWESADAFFEQVAKKWGKYNNVIYEIFNEPLDLSWDAKLKPYAEHVGAKIRAIDPDNLIIMGTRNWSSRPDEAAANPARVSNMAYTIHFYSATHKGDIRA
ncbi:MAG: glycoside hydrolase family 5 protein, partial [Cytophagales bacterium]|nr:glycoside hydrolase family 5 protein [Cytophagales bacterium]